MVPRRRQYSGWDEAEQAFTRRSPCRDDGAIADADVADEDEDA